MELLKSQRAAVFNVISDYGMDVAKIRWTTRDHQSGVGQVPAIEYEDTQFWFVFSRVPNGWVVTFSPGVEVQHGRRQAMNWNEVLGFVNQWCGLVDRELSTVDPWEELERQVVSFSSARFDQTSSAAFDSSEQAKVLKTMNAMQALLLDFARENEAHQEAIKEGVRILVDSSKVQGRKAFFWLVVGFIANTAVSMTLSPEQTRSIFELLKAGLTGVVRFIG